MNQGLPVHLPCDDLHRAIRQARSGICVYDASHRIVFVNDAYCASMSVPAGTLRPGLDLEASLRLLAYHGAFGPGDPVQQIAERLALDRTRSHYRRRHLADGRVFELFIDPMPLGGFVVTNLNITQLTHDERAARERVMLVENALSFLRPGVLLFDAERRLMLANRSGEEMYGLGAGGLKPGLDFETFIRRLAASGEFTAGDTEAYVAATLAYDRTRPRRLQRTRPDGTVILATSDPMPGGGFVLTDTDITALAHAEDEARRRAALMDGILASMPHGICVYGPDRRVTMLNPAYTSIMKGAPVAVGDHLFEVIRRRAAVGEYGPGRPSDVERQQFAYDIARPQARRRVRPDGTAIDIRTAPLPDGGHVSVVTDITPMVQAETEATRRAAVLAAMLASIRHGIVLFGPDKRILAANPVAADMLGVSVEALRPGTHQHALLAETMRGGGFGEGEAARAFLEQIEARDITRSYRHERSTPDGRILEIHTDPTADGGFVVTYADVTVDRRQAAALREARDAAEAASQAKSRFLATMSHELRTPLNAVIGFSDALAGLATRPDPAQIAEFAQAINDAGRHLLALINDILDVARIEAGRFDLSADRIELARVVAACLRIVGPQAQVAGVTINTALAPDVPILVADERRLRQVLLNLLSNAIKFTPVGGTITVAAALDPDALHILVRDTGIGLPAAQLERVFEPFTQLDASLSRRFQGSGLGLYLSRALVAAHGGTLHLESEEGEGTTAVLSLPHRRLLTPSPAAREPDERTHRH